ncbi:MAG: DUF397 domain-containing protein [Acidobacteriaceae bacterium]|nr:DUF397 domain-containing protein [Acidobacteriaceae bacterium]
MERLDSGDWRKSSYSAGNGGDCVEAGGAHGLVLVRDTKNQGGAVLRFSADVWRAFAMKVKQTR